MPLQPVSTPLVNGARYSWASIVVSIANVEQGGIRSIDYDHAIERGEARGAGTQLLGFTKGTYKPSCSFSLLAEDYYNLINTLAQNNGGSYMDAPFDITVNYSDGGINHVDKIVGCKIKKPARQNKQGNDALEVKVDVDCLYVMEDGLTPFQGFQQ